MTADSRVLQSFTISKDFSFQYVERISELLHTTGYIMLLFLERNADHFIDFLVDENEVHEPEEIMQKIDLTKQQVVGVMQGRTNNALTSRSYDFKIDFSQKLYNFLFVELSLFIPISSVVHSIVTDQINQLKDYKRAYQARSDIILKIKGKIDSVITGFHDSYFRDEILSTLKTSSMSMSSKLGLVLKINAMPDLLLDDSFKQCLYGNIPKSIFNEAELVFARSIDKLPGTLWMRNTPLNGVGFPFSMGTFYPDFMLVKGLDSGSPKILFIETKGSHLIGNTDSNSKLMACQLINDKFQGDINLFFGGFDAALKAAVSFVSC